MDRQALHRDRAFDLRRTGDIDESARVM